MPAYNAVNNCRETGIGSYWIPDWLDIEVGQANGGALASFFEPGEGLIVLWQAYINQGIEKSRHEASFGNFLELLEHLERLASFT
jgi:hypothetical protein